LQGRSIERPYEVPGAEESQYVYLQYFEIEQAQRVIQKRNPMEEEKKQMQPTIGEYQGKPIIRIPTVDNPNPETTWHWLSFGKNKAKAIVKYFDAIKKFAEE
jgi:hypothetical protein